MPRIRCLIVDDEPLARRRVRGFLRGHADVDIVGECGNGEEAVRLIRELSPGLVFLDIQMPGLDGFEALRQLEPPVPAIVFTTAHDQYAVRAFETRALDYLMKPFSQSRFDDSLQRAREADSPTKADFQIRIQELLRDTAPPGEGERELIPVKVDSRIVLLQKTRIDFVESERDYIRIHSGKDVYLTRETMNAFEIQLGSKRFVRIHRSTIVNTHAVRELHSMPGGDFVVILKDGTKLTLSRRYKDRAELALGLRL